MSEILDAIGAYCAIPGIRAIRTIDGGWEIGVDASQAPEEDGGGPGIRPVLWLGGAWAPEGWSGAGAGLDDSTDLDPIGHPEQAAEVLLRATLAWAAQRAEARADQAGREAAEARAAEVRLLRARAPIHTAAAADLLGIHESTLRAMAAECPGLPGGPIQAGSGTARAHLRWPAAPEALAAWVREVERARARAQAEPEPEPKPRQPRAPRRAAPSSSPPTATSTATATTKGKRPTSVAQILRERAERAEKAGKGGKGGKGQI